MCALELIDLCGKRCCTPKDISPFLNVPFYGEARRKGKKSAGVYENMRILVLLPENDKKKGKIEVNFISLLHSVRCESFVNAVREMPCQVCFSFTLQQRGGVTRYTF